MSWHLQNNKLTKIFSFENQTELSKFLLKIAMHADQIGHHPDVTIYKCREMKIELFTHDKNQVTALDYSLADYIDSI